MFNRMRTSGLLGLQKFDHTPPQEEIIQQDRFVGGFLNIYSPPVVSVDTDEDKAPAPAPTSPELPPAAQEVQATMVRHQPSHPTSARKLVGVVSGYRAPVVYQPPDDPNESKIIEDSLAASYADYPTETPGAETISPVEVAKTTTALVTQPNGQMEFHLNLEAQTPGTYRIIINLKEVMQLRAAS